MNRPGTPINIHHNTVSPPLLNSPELQLRFLNPGDLPEVKRLCKEWFPIEYPDKWWVSPMFRPPKKMSNSNSFSEMSCWKENLNVEFSLLSRYLDITSTHKFYSVAAIYRGQIVGMVVAEIKDADSLPKEDSEILASSFRTSRSRIGYILSLGVVKDLRKQGIASFLLENLIAHLTSPDHFDVKGVYLHVLTTNMAAITFYEHRGFRPHLFLPYYYAIG